MAGHDRSPEWRHRATAPYPCLRETHNAAPTGVRKHLEPRSLVAPNISRSGCREGTNGQDECISRDDDRVFPEPSIRLSEVQIKLTNHERKLISRVRKRHAKTRGKIAALIAHDLGFGVDDPSVHEEVEHACRAWEALPEKPEPRTTLQHLLGVRSGLLVAEAEVLQAARKREIEDDDIFFHC